MSFSNLRDFSFLSKPFTYALAMDQLGMDTIYKYIGREPSGRNFNEIVLDYNGKLSQLQTMNLEIQGLSDTIEQLHFF